MPRLDWEKAAREDGRRRGERADADWLAAHPGGVVRTGHGHQITQVARNHFEGRPLEAPSLSPKRRMVLLRELADMSTDPDSGLDRDVLGVDRASDALRLVEGALPYVQTSERCWAHRWRRDARFLIASAYGRQAERLDDVECPYCGGDASPETQNAPQPTS